MPTEEGGQNWQNFAYVVYGWPLGPINISGFEETKVDIVGVPYSLGVNINEREDSILHQKNF